MGRIGIFLDRDGTINEEVDFLRSTSDLRLIPGSADAIREANERNWGVFVVTNQSGIARGILSETTLDNVHAALMNELTKHNARIDAFYYCPHHPEIGDETYRRSCECRKPNIGMLEQAAREFDIRHRRPSARRANRQKRGCNHRPRSDWLREEGIGTVPRKRRSNRLCCEGSPRCHPVRQADSATESTRCVLIH
jgi:D,D-heptose 1,7-bisphosphate phosphatase